MQKTKGEGSRGGHVLGHTKSGKPIYQSGRSATNRLSPKGIRGYSSQDHVDAAAAHTALAASTALPADHVVDARKMAAFHAKAATRPAPGPKSVGPPIQAPVAHATAAGPTVAAPAAAPKAPRTQSAEGKAGRAMASLDSRMSKFNDDVGHSSDWKKQRAEIEAHAGRVHDEHFGHMSAADHMAAANAALTHAGTQAERKQAVVARAAHGAMAAAMLKRQRTAAAAAPVAVAKERYRPEASTSVAQTFVPVGPDGYEVESDGDDEATLALFVALAEAGVPLEMLRIDDLMQLTRPRRPETPYRRPTLIRSSVALECPECLVKFAQGDDTAFDGVVAKNAPASPKPPPPPKPAVVAGPPPPAPVPAAAAPPAPKPAAASAAPPPPPAPAPPPPPAPAAPAPAAPAAPAAKPPGNATLGRTNDGHTVWAGAKADSALYRGFSPRDHAQAANLHALAGNHDAAAEHRAMHAKLTSGHADRPSAAVLAARPRMGGGRVYRSLTKLPQGLGLGYTQLACSQKERPVTAKLFKSNATDALERLRQRASEPVAKSFFGLFGAKSPAVVPAPPPAAVAAAPGATPGKGEGSRGGKVVGHTATGKPIYAAQHANNYSGFTSAEHGDAVRAHAAAGYAAMKAGDTAAEKAHGALRYQHIQAMQRMNNAPTIITGHGDVGLPVRQAAARRRSTKPAKPRKPKAPANVMGAAATQADA